METQFPEYQFDYLTPDDFPIEEVLTTGYIFIPPDAETTVVFTVPEGIEVLYFRFWFSGVQSEQLPYIDIYDPNGEFVESICSYFGDPSYAHGSAHIESPMAGEWTIRYSDWEGVHSHYEIGTGPHFFTSTLLTDHDLMMRIWDDTWHFFVGWLPHYSGYEMATIDKFLAAGGGFLIVRESWWSVVLKPVLRLYSDKTLSVDLSLDFPGAPSYAEPEGRLERFSDFTRMSWDNVRVEASQYAEILYEGKLFSPLRHLRVDNIAGTRASVFNNSDYPLHDVHLFAYMGDNRYCYGHLRGIRPHEQASLVIDQRFSTEEFVAYLHEHLIQEGRRSGLTERESVEFFTKYRWVRRYLARSAKVGGFWGIYRFCTDAYDDLIPLKTFPESKDRARTMWVVLKNISSRGGVNAFHAVETPPADSFAARHTEELSLVIHEYGVIEENYGGSSEGSKEADFGDFHFYDDYLIDETHNGGWPYWPIFHTWGNNELAETLRVGVEQVQADGAAAMSSFFQWEEEILIGDEDTQCDPSWGCYEFPPGSFPAVAMGKFYYGGKIIGINDSQILADQLDNLQFMRNCVGWLEAGATGDGPDIDVVPSQLHVSMAIGDTLERTVQIFNFGDSTLTFDITSPDVDWLTVNPLSGEVHSLDSLPVTLTFSPQDPVPPESLEVSLTIESNDPNEAQCVVLVQASFLGFVRGDANADFEHNIFDALLIIYWLGGEADDPQCINAADAEDDEDVDIFDGLRIIYWLGGAADAPPSPCCSFPDDCGPDPTPGALTCESFPPCGWHPKPATATTFVGSAEASRVLVEVEARGKAVEAVVTLTNAEPVLGFNFAIEYDPELLTAKAVDKAGLITESLDIFAGGVSEPGLAKVAAVSDIEVEDGLDRLEVFNVLGQRVITLVDERREAGYKTAQWDGRDTHGEEVATGIYVFRLRAGAFMATRKVVLIR